MVDIEIRHTHADGTTAEGSRPGDGVLEILRPFGFRVGRGALCIPGTVDKDGRTLRINDAAEALRAAGHTATVDIDNTPRPAEVVRAAFAQRAERRAERLDGRAERAAAESVRRRDAARAIGDGIPFGQPVQPPGHHSHKPHMRALDRIDNHRQKERDAARAADQLAARADGVRSNAAHREDPRAIMRRIEKLEADGRRYVRELEGYTRESKHNGRVIYRDVQPPATGGRAEDLRRWRDQAAEEVTHLRGVLAQLDDAGAFVAWGKEHFRAGDMVRAGGVWLKVIKVNAKSVTVPWIIMAMEGRATDRTETVKWDQVTGRRRDGLQWDTPNGEPWPVELAVKVARWRSLLAGLNRRDVRYDSPEAGEARHVEYARRLVHGLDLDAADAQVKAITDSIEDTGERRALAAACLAVFDRLAAGESVPDIKATLTPITGAPAWTLPTDREPEKVRVDRLQPGDLVAGEVEGGYDGARVLRRSFCGPVEHVSDVLNRRERGEWVTVTLTTGASADFQTHRWLEVFTAASAPKAGDVEPPAEQVAPAGAAGLVVVSSGECRGCGNPASIKGEHTSVTCAHCGVLVSVRAAETFDAGPYPFPPVTVATPDGPVTYRPGRDPYPTPAAPAVSSWAALIEAGV